MGTSGGIVRFRVLGPLDVRDDSGRLLVPPRRKQRLLLGLLVLSANETLSTTRLVDELWAGRAPRSAVANLQSYVSGLRRLLDGPSAPAGQRLRTQRGGYLLRVGADELDAGVFDRLETTGRRLLHSGDPAEANELLTRALALWRGRVLEDLPLPAGRQPEVDRLEERRLAVVEDRVEAQLALGWHADVAAELRALTRAHPMRERLWEQLMLALYHSGRRADALDAYREAYRLFGAELGIEPGTSLRRLHERILRGDESLDRPPATVRVVAAPQRPRQLPPDVADFTGRAGDLAALDELLGAASTVAVVAAGGTAGVGKTALAVHWGHHAAERFPDGQLYVNLNGYAAAAPVSPMDALTRFLRALGVPAERVPAGLEEAAAMYRSLLADRRVLVVLDNAATPEQVRPMLPAGRGSKAVVTSRDRLSGLVALDGARRLDLDVLTAAEAAELVARLVGQDRAAAAPDEVAELARLCAYLPLALRVAATTLVDRPDAAVADLVAELSTPDRLSVLTVAGDASAAVRAAFDLSYARLSVAARRLFRLLGSSPAEDFTAASAAALAGLDRGATALVLDRLAGASLLETRQPGRFGFHDLLRLYAAERSRREDTEPDRSAAATRLLGWYVRASRAAAAEFSPRLLRLPAVPADGGQPPAAFDSPGAASAWLDEERHNLVAAARYAGDHRCVTAAELSDALRGYFRQRRYPLDWLAVAHAGVAGATDGDLRTRAAAQLGLAEASSMAGEVDTCAVHFRRAAQLSHEAGWSSGEAAAVASRADSLGTAGRFAEAVEHYGRALAIHRSTGSVSGQAQNLSGMGLTYLNLGQPDRAVRCLTEAIPLTRQAGARNGEAHTLNRLGLAYHAMGALATAVTCFEEALTVAREIADHVPEAATLDSLAAARRDLGEFDAALADARRAVAMTERTAQHASSAHVLNTLATVELCLGEATRARDHHAEARRLAAGSGSRPAECEALIGLSAAERALGHADRAADHAADALRLAGSGALRAAALTAQAQTHLVRGQPTPAADGAQEAVAAATASGQRLARARALVTLGLARSATGAGEAAAAHWRAAHEILTRAGAAPERDRAAGLLAGSAGSRASLRGWPGPGVLPRISSSVEP